MKKGTRIVFTSGEYSDYSHEAYLKATCDFDEQEVIELFAKDLGLSFDEWDNYGTVTRVWFKLEDGKPRSIKPARFISWLQAKGYVTEADDIEEWYIGDYGSFESYVEKGNDDE